MSQISESNDFFHEFIDDYFAECEEHLMNIRQHLLALEKYINSQEIPLTIVNELFRSFHTLKGLSGMVGIEPAEQLSHEMENYLRKLRDDQIIITNNGFDALIAGTSILDLVIESVKKKKDFPDIQPVIKQLESNINLAEKYLLDHQEKTENNYQEWLFMFTPEKQLAERGITVNEIRNRLESIGKIIDNRPCLKDNGDIVFEFRVNTNHNNFSDWEKDGLIAQLNQKNDPDILETEIQQNLEPETTETKVLETEIQQNLEPETTEIETLIDSPKNLAISNSNSSFVRVDLTKLDLIMQMVGDLVITRAKLQEQLTQIKSNLSAKDSRNLREINLTLERQLRDLREGIMRVRLVPISEIFARMQFVIRDLIRETNKKINLQINGQETEIDKFVVEKMSEPLLHFVRNSVSHGIEDENTRRKLGKPAEGTISLTACTAGEMVIIEISDDGKGINIPEVISKGKKLGLLEENYSQNNCDCLTILEVICAPGFSTKEKADLASGRGVGMAIIKNTVQELGGTLSLETEKNKGTRFIIHLPLTLAITDALIVKVQQQIYAIPQTSVQEVTNIHTQDIIKFENNKIISYRGKILALLHLATLFNLGDYEHNNNLKIIIINNSINCVALGVDEVIGLREIVVRSLLDPLVQVTGIAGATELGDGKVVLILDVPSLVRHGQKINLEYQKNKAHDLRK